MDGTTRRPLLIVDGDNLAHRAYHSTPKTVKGAGGKVINAVVGFVNSMVAAWEREDPRAVFVAWDTLGVDTYRNKLWPPYQSGRVFEPEIREQLSWLPTVCEAFGFGVGKQPGYEADDLMASAALQEVAEGGTCLLLTTDRDSYQLVSESITVLSPKKGSPAPDRIGPREVVERMGVQPSQVRDFKALSGDSSDKIPGAKGIGPKGAASLLRTHGTLDAVLTAWGTHSQEALIRTFFEVVSMRTDAVVKLPASSPNWAGGADALRAMGAKNLAERVATLAHAKCRRQNERS